MDDRSINKGSDRIKANAAYSYRIPDPHRVNIPPNVFTDEGDVPVDIGNLVPQPGLDLSFLSSVLIDHLYDREGLLKDVWTYERRHSATQILPWLYLGPMVAAKDKDALRKEGITMILGVAHRSNFPSRMATGPMKAATELGIDKDLIEVADNSELIAAFPQLAQAINEHLVNVHKQPSHAQRSISGPNATGKVLVFCESGNERSAAVVAAYLIQMFESVDHVKAIQMCNQRRFSTNFDEGLKQYLFSYYGIVKARRDVAATGHAGSTRVVSGGSTQGLSKRSFDATVTDEGDVDMEVEDDLERFGGRDFTPFRDEKVSGDGEASSGKS